ncbi:MAG: RNA methyltransferase [Bacilli bacterium]|nr:RNA methyltransferase [Bacilli bacterium]
MRQITSPQNPLVKSWMKLSDRATRNECKQFLVEGNHLVEEAYKAGILQETIITHLEDAIPGVPSTHVSMEVIEKLAKTKTPQGVMGLCRINAYPTFSKKRYLILDGIQDPGNLGTLIRSALGFGIEGLITTPDGVDPYHDKVVRSAQGALFHLELHTLPFVDFLPQLKEQGFYLYGTDVERGTLLEEVTPTPKFALMLGSEGGGLSSYARKQVDNFVHIPTQSILESLNVAIAGSIILYHMMQTGGY